MFVVTLNDKLHSPQLSLLINSVVDLSVTHVIILIFWRPDAYVLLLKMNFYLYLLLLSSLSPALFSTIELNHETNTELCIQKDKKLRYIISGFDSSKIGTEKRSFYIEIGGVKLLLNIQFDGDFYYIHLSKFYENINFRCTNEILL